MSVETVLDKISNHNSHVLGCVAAHKGRVHHNLPGLYELVEANAVSEYASIMFEATDALETGQDAFDQMFLEYEGHSIYARRLGDGVLVLVNEPMQRANFRRMQVGVNLFIKPLTAALEDEANGSPDDFPPLPKGPDPKKPKKTLGRLFRGVRY